MAHLLDRLLMRPYVKDEGLARYIDDVMAKPQLVFCVELSCHRTSPALPGASRYLARRVGAITSSAGAITYARKL